MQTNTHTLSHCPFSGGEDTAEEKRLSKLDNKNNEEKHRVYR